MLQNNFVSVNNMWCIMYKHLNMSSNNITEMYYILSNHSKNTRPNFIKHYKNSSWEIYTQSCFNKMQ